MDRPVFFRKAGKDKLHNLGQVNSITFHNPTEKGEGETDPNAVITKMTMASSDVISLGKDETKALKTYLDGNIAVLNLSEGTLTVPPEDEVVENASDDGESETVEDQGGESEGTEKAVKQDQPALEKDLF